MKKYQQALMKTATKGTGGLSGDLRKFADRLVSAGVIELPDHPVRSR